MARMHSRARGKSRSKKPFTSTKPAWVRTSTKEIELLIGKLAKEGKMSSEIGLVLRDSYGVPDVRQQIGKRITAVMDDKGLSPKLPEDLLRLIRRAISIRKHLEKNKHDKTALHGLQLTESKIRRLAKYYKTAKKLQADWKYSPKEVKIYLE